MIMNRWRIGSLSMGVMLVALGVTMLVSLIREINMFHTITTFWPIIMVCLGVEILLHLFIRKGSDTDVKMKYDMLSIVFISIILAVSTFFYGITFFAGTFGSQADMYAALGIHSETVYAESDVELVGTNELVVFSGINSIKAISTAEENIRVDYHVAVSASDREYAESILSGIVEFENGERAYMLSNTGMFFNNRRLGYPIISCIIYLPQDKTLDLSQFYGQFEYDSLVENQIICPRPFDY